MITSPPQDKMSSHGNEEYCYQLGLKVGGKEAKIFLMVEDGSRRVFSKRVVKNYKVE